MPEDKVYVFYENLNNDIILSVYNKDKWIKKQILKNTQNDALNIYFKCVLNEENIHVFYNIYNKNSKITTFFHQVINKEIKMSQPKVIDRIKNSYNIPFVIHVGEDYTILIMYENISDAYAIGYKILKNSVWSKFYIIEKNKYPYTDYSLIGNEDHIESVYIRNNKKNKSIVYSNGKYPSFYHNELFKNIDAESCLIFKIKNNSWINWLDKGNIYSSFSVDQGKHFSTPPHYEPVILDDIVKADYLSNFYLDKEYISLDNVYIDIKRNPNYIMISNIYPYIMNSDKKLPNKNYEKYWNYIKDYLNRAYEKVLNLEKTLKEKNRFITEINYSLANKKAEARRAQNNFNDISKKYSECEKEKENIMENVNSLQETIISKDKRINELETINVEKENQIIALNNKITDLERKLSSFKNDFIDCKNKVMELENINMIKEDEIMSLKNNMDVQSNQIMDFKNESETLKTKIDNLENRINDYNNESIIKKLFGVNK